MCVCFFFFFSSRRRHTRFDCDWSSDVCSSDLPRVPCLARLEGAAERAASRPDEPGSRPKPSPEAPCVSSRSEEHTSELQSQSNLVCRLLLEKKKKKKKKSKKRNKNNTNKHSTK